MSEQERGRTTHEGSEEKDGVVCPYCSSTKLYSRLGGHWSANGSCTGPNREDIPYDLLEGLLLGSGSINSNSRGCNIKIQSVNKEFVEYVADELGVLACKVKKLPDSTSEYDYGDVWCVYTRSHALIDAYAKNWLDGDGEFRTPDGITTSKKSRRHWFATKGHIMKKKHGWELRLGYKSTRREPEFWVEKFPNWDWRINRSNQSLYLTSKETVGKGSAYFGPPVEPTSWRWDPLQGKP